MKRGNYSRHPDISGDDAEQLALHWLRQHGLTLVEKNYRCKGGEIDLIMRENNAIIFVEVRYRKHSNFGSSLESVDWRKQKKLIIAARHFLASQKHFLDAPCRFDVMAASPATGQQTTVVWQWIKHAFSL